MSHFHNIPSFLNAYSVADSLSSFILINLLIRNYERQKKMSTEKKKNGAQILRRIISIINWSIARNNSEATFIISIVVAAVALSLLSSLSSTWSSLSTWPFLRLVVFPGLRRRTDRVLFSGRPSPRRRYSGWRGLMSPYRRGGATVERCHMDVAGARPVLIATPRRSRRSERRPDDGKRSSDQLTLNKKKAAWRDCLLAE